MLVSISREHFNTFDSLATKIGLDRIMPFIPETNKDTLLAKLSEDIHLNNIPLKLWDRIPHELRDTFKHPLLPVIEKAGGWPSISTVVCLLKHVATYRIAGATPDFKD